MNSVGLYARMVVANLRAAAGQRSDAVLQILATALGQAGGLIVLWSLLNRTAGLPGIDLHMAMLVFGLVTGSLGVSQLALDGVWNLRIMIANGDLDYVLLRPRSVLAQVIFSRAGLHGAGSVVVGTVLVCVSLAGQGAARPGLSFLGGVFIALAGVALRTVLYVAANSIAFWGNSAVDLPMAVHRLTDFGKYPLPMYGATTQIVLATVCPVAFIGFFPAALMLGREPWAGFAPLGLLCLAVFAGLALLVFSRGLDRYREG